MARVADEPATEGDGRPATRDEAAGNDHRYPESPQRALGPHAPPGAFLGGEEPSFGEGPEAAADEVGDVVTYERACRRAEDQEGDARVGAPRGCDAEGDEDGLAGQHREDRVQRGDDDRDHV